MKYLILGPQRDRIMRVVDEQPTREGIRTLEVSNAKAATAQTLLDEGKQPIILNGDVVSLTELREEGTEVRWDDETSAFKIVVPDSLTRRQFHLAALSLGLTKEIILTAINTIQDETQQALAKVDYEEASVFKRDWPLLVQMAHTLSLTDDQIDQAFIQGAKL
jgi:hypothetical protein